MHFLIVIYTACKSLAKWWWLFLGTSHFDLEGWQKYPTGWILWGAYSPGIRNIFKKSHLCQFLMDSKDIYIYGSIMTYTILQKIAAILNFRENMPPSLILCVFGPF